MSSAGFVTVAMPAIATAVERTFPGGTVESIEALATDDAGEGVATKAAGYGIPLDVHVRLADGSRRRLVFHTASANAFGHDRRSDRAAEMLLAYDTFDEVPRHVRAVDVGAIGRDGSGLVSLHDAGEFYLLTEYAEGRIYAEDLRKITRTRRATDEDRRRARELARYLRELHEEPLADEVAYRRSVRDLVGSGEGIYGIVDGYPDGVEGASRERLARIESAAATWRWRLRDRAGRLRRIHGDFHPFNIVIAADGSPWLLDASRGSRGDPSDDVTCLAINYVFFAVGEPASWREGLGVLWDDFWDEYLKGQDADDLLGVVPPFLAWRGLVLANPVWYPDVELAARQALLGMIERALDDGRFDPAAAHALFP
jgi:hypothetical protein